MNTKSMSQWDVIISQAGQNPASLQDGETIKVVGNIMKTNVAACSSIGSYFYPQIGRIYLDMLSMYRATSQMISDAVTREGRYIKSSYYRPLIKQLTSERPHCHQDAKSSRDADHQKRDPQTYRYIRSKSR